MLTVVILVAVLSVLNAGLYTASRLLHVLSSNNEAPSWLARKISVVCQFGVYSPLL